MREGEMDAHLGYEKNSVTGNNSGNSRHGSYPKKIQTEHEEAVISIPRGCNDMKNINNAPNKEVAATELDNLEKKWRRKVSICHTFMEKQPG